MPAERVDHDVVREFWARKSRERSNRWTSEEMLAFELGLLREAMPRPRSVLDLGSGHGELSRPLCNAVGARLVAVDFAPAYGRSFTGSREVFVAASVTEFATRERFALVLLFGVVTSLDEADESPLYATMARSLEQGGVAVVKNQCARDEGFVTSGYSEQLGSDYSGRYPAASDQQARLLETFASVERHDYPERFNPWPNSAHVAFVCRV